ncbi:hypothetical protein ACQ143_06485 [Microbacterium sp. MC2]
MVTAAGYPPEPWRLRGDFVVSVFLVPVRELPRAVAEHAPVGARPVTIAGRAVVGVTGVRYTPAGQLAYDELLVALPVWRGRGRVAVTIPWIRVTTAVSRDGGRALSAKRACSHPSTRCVAGRAAERGQCDHRTRRRGVRPAVGCRAATRSSQKRTKFALIGPFRSEVRAILRSS